MNHSPFPTGLRFRSPFVYLTRPVGFSVLAFIGFLSASTFAAAPRPRIVAQTKAAPPAQRGGLAVGMEVFDISKVDQVPEPKFRTEPQYPFEMKRAGVTGEVIVEFLVDTSGNVLTAFVVRSTRREFETYAVQAVSKWKFKPGRKGDRAVITHMQVPIVFTLNNE